MNIKKITMGCIPIMSILIPLNFASANNELDIDVNVHGDEVGVVVEPNRNIGGSSTNIKLQIRKSGTSSYRDVRTEGRAPYEWGKSNRNSSDRRLEDLSSGKYYVKATIREGSYRNQETIKSFNISGSSDSSSSGSSSSSSSSSSGSFDRYRNRERSIDEQSNSHNDRRSGYHKDKGILEVNIKNRWYSVCCDSGDLKLSTKACIWDQKGRKMIDLTNNRYLNCPESSGNRRTRTDCECVRSKDDGEKMHGYRGGSVGESIETKEGAPTSGKPIYPNTKKENCVTVENNGELVANDSNRVDCYNFRLRKIDKDLVDRFE